MSYLNKQQSEITTAAKNKIRALKHPLRQNILELVKSKGNRMNVTDIYKTLKIEQSVGSMHLGILRREGFIKTKRDGRTIWYSVDDAAIKNFIKIWEKEVG